jgi:hypothetical protein
MAAQEYVYASGWLTLRVTEELTPGTLAKFPD